MDLQIHALKVSDKHLKNRILEDNFPLTWWNLVDASCWFQGSSGEIGGSSKTLCAGKVQKTIVEEIATTLSGSMANVLLGPNTWAWFGKACHFSFFYINCVGVSV